jgi:iron complex transport system substrate-binding protein
MKYIISMVVMLLLAPSALAAPQKVVSLNLCTDQLAVTMLPKEYLKGVSFNATDKALSLVAATARDVPQLKGTLEEMAEIQPDFVLMAQGQNPRLQEWLGGNGIPFLALGAVSDIDDMQAQVAEVARALDNDEYALNLRARQNIIIGQSKLPRPDMRVAVYYPRGFTDGRGTLLNDLIGRMGGINVAEEQGSRGMSYLALEELVMLQPDVLIIPLYDYDVASQAEKLSRHPALKNINAYVVPIPGQYLTCPHLGLEAVANTITVMVEDGIKRQERRRDERMQRRFEGSKSKAGQ